MNSASLAEYGLVEWVPFHPGNERALLARAPRRPGIYVIRWRITAVDLASDSDLLYIGSAANQQGLNMRLRQYFHPGPTQRTNKRILEMISDSTDFEIAFVVTSGPARAKGLEAELLEQYERDHRKLPPWNLRR